MASLFWFTNWIGMLMYFIPLVVVLTVYTIRSYRDIVKDIKGRREDPRTGYNSYHPCITVGTLVCRFLGSTIPCVNLLCMIFDCLSSITTFIENLLDIPIIPKKTK